MLTQTACRFTGNIHRITVADFLRINGGIKGKGIGNLDCKLFADNLAGIIRHIHSQFIIAGVGQRQRKFCLFGIALCYCPCRSASFAVIQ